MRNADKPVMPQSLAMNSEACYTTSDFYDHNGFNGLTKLEHFALKIHCATISHHGKACLDESINEAGRFLKEFEK